MAGINLGKRLLTASILIPIVWIAAMFPASWFVVNLGMTTQFKNCKLVGFPLMCIKEYSQIMEKILAYVRNGKEEKYVVIHSDLIAKLNNPYFSCLLLVAIHLSVLTLNEPIIQISMAYIFVGIAFVKLYQYCMFMQYPEK